MANAYDQYVQDEKTPRRWRLPLSWPAFLAFGVVIYDFLGRRLIAVTPEECWCPEEGVQVASMPGTVEAKS